MTKKDFEALAEAIKEITARKAHGDRIAEIIADKLKNKYPRFNKEKFLKACHGEHIHKWGKPKASGLRWCQTCDATIDKDGGIIN